MGGMGSEHNVQMFQMALLLFKENTNVPDYSEIRAYIQKKWPRQARFTTILSFDLHVRP